MRTVKLVLAIFIIFFMSGCAGGPPVIQGEEEGPYRHYYRIIVLDGKGDPLPGATVDCFFFDDNRLVKTATLVTDEKGVVEGGVNVSLNRSAFKYRVKKDGYYEREGALHSDYGDMKYRKPVNGGYVLLFRNVDYLDRNFAASLSDTAIRDSMLDFVESFMRRNGKVESTLFPWSVSLARHGNRHYFRLTVEDNTMYNSGAFFEETLVAKIFRDTACPALAFVNTQTDDSTMLYGYDLTVRALCRNFCEPEDEGRVREFRYLVPGTALERYLEGYISHEKLLESSTCIVDGRIFETSDASSRTNYPECRFPRA